jgi:hypothetical protein
MLLKYVSGNYYNGELLTQATFINHNRCYISGNIDFLNKHGIVAALCHGD